MQSNYPANLEDDSNYQVFRDCVFAAVVEKLSFAAAAGTTRQAKKKRRSARPITTVRRQRKGQTSINAKSTSITSDGTGEDKTEHTIKDDEVDGETTATAATTIPPENNPSELADFSEYLATEIFTSLPEDLQALAYNADAASTSDTAQKYNPPLTPTEIEDILFPLPPTIPQTLQTYTLIDPPKTDTQTFMSPILHAYTTHLLRPPPLPSSTRLQAQHTTGCELCTRTHLPLTYHHLIPRSMHEKSVKRGWHTKQELSNVAWLCRPCHSFVHRVLTNEELAREWFEIDTLVAREDVRRWCGWVSGVRWAKR